MDAGMDESINVEMESVIEEKINYLACYLKSQLTAGDFTVPVRSPISRHLFTPSRRCEPPPSHIFSPILSSPQITQQEVELCAIC